MAEEAWDAYLAHDVARDLEVLLHADDISEVIERYGENILRTEFYQLTYSQPYGPEAESATSVTFPFYDVTVAELARRVGASNPIR